MANLGQVALLLSDVQKWNEWRKKHHEIEINLEKVNLDGKNLSNANLENANLSGANLTRAMLTEAKLNNADLSYANLTRATLTDAELNNADLSYANLTRATLTDAELNDADLSHANLTRANLANAHLKNTDLVNVNFKNAQLKDATLENVDLDGAFNFGYSNFRNEKTHNYASNFTHIGDQLSDKIPQKIQTLLNDLLKKLPPTLKTKPSFLAILILTVMITAGWKIIPTILADLFSPSFQHPFFVSFLFCVALLLLFIYFNSYREDWSGMKNKKLWDWLDLLLIPVFLAIGSIYLEVTAESRQEQLIQRQKAKEAVLKYYERMAGILDGIATIKGKIEAIETSSQDQEKNSTSAKTKEQLKEELKAKKNIAKSLTVATISILKESDESGKKEIREIFKFLRESDLLPEQENEQGKIDFQDADLSELDLGELDLQYINFKNANLTKVNFQETDLIGVNLEGAYLEDTNFSRANLKDAQWGFAQRKVKNHDQLLTKLGDEKFQGTKLRGMKVLQGIEDLPFGEKTKLIWQILNEQDSLKPNDLRNADLSGAYLRFANLSGLDLSTANLRDADLQNTILINTKLDKKCQFLGWNCDISKIANLEGAYLAMTKINPDHFQGKNRDYLKIWKIINFDLGYLNQYLEKQCHSSSKNSPKYQYCNDPNPKLRELIRNCPTFQPPLSEVPDDCQKIKKLVNDVLLKEASEEQKKMLKTQHKMKEQIVEEIKKDFQQNKLRQVTIENADLEGVNLEGFNLEKTTFKNVTLTGSQFLNTTLTSTIFDATTLKNVKVKSHTLKEVQFKNAGQNTPLENVVFEDTKLKRVKFSNTFLEDTKFEGKTILENVVFEDTKLKRVKFSNTSLEDTKFEGKTILEDVTFENVHFQLQEDINKQEIIREIQKILTPNCSFEDDENNLNEKLESIDIDGRKEKKRIVTITKINCPNS